MINIGVETCQELGQRGVSKSGIYPIDPDGQDQNESLIQGNLLRGIVNCFGLPTIASSMAVRVVEFSNRVYKIRKIFA